MRDTPHHDLTVYIRDLADMLGLKDWEFDLRRESSDEGARAEISMSRNKNNAAITLCDRWFVRTPEEQRRTLVHELLHAHTTRLCRVVSRLAEEVDDPTHRYANSAFNEEEEIVIDSLAGAIATFLPLPPIGAEGRNA